jgi:hypothetical protein
MLVFTADEATHRKVAELSLDAGSAGAGVDDSAAVNVFAMTHSDRLAHLARPDERNA